MQEITIPTPEQGLGGFQESGGTIAATPVLLYDQAGNSAQIPNGSLQVIVTGGTLNTTVSFSGSISTDIGSVQIIDANNNIGEIPTANAVKTAGNHVLLVQQIDEGGDTLRQNTQDTILNNQGTLATDANLRSVRDGLATVYNNQGTLATETAINQLSASLTAILNYQGTQSTAAIASGVVALENTATTILNEMGTLATAAGQVTTNAFLLAIDTNQASQATSALQTAGNNSLITIVNELGTLATTIEQTAGNTILTAILNNQGTQSTEVLLPPLTAIMNNQGTLATSANQGNATAVQVMNNQGTLATSALQQNLGAATAAVMNNQGTLATATAQTAGNASLAVVVNDMGTLATVAAQTAIGASLTAILNYQGTQSTGPLATIMNNEGTLATSALQAAGNADLAIIVNDLGTLATAAAQAAGNAVDAVVMNDMGTVATSANQVTQSAYLLTLATNSALAATAANQQALFNQQAAVIRTYGSSGTIPSNVSSVIMGLDPSAVSTDSFGRLRTSDPDYRFDGQLTAPGSPGAADGRVAVPTNSAIMLGTFFNGAAPEGAERSLHLRLRFISRRTGRSAANEVRNQSRATRVEASNVQHPPVVGIGDGEVVGAHTDHDSASVAHEVLPVLAQSLRRMNRTGPRLRVRVGHEPGNLDLVLGGPLERQGTVRAAHRDEPHLGDHVVQAHTRGDADRDDARFAAAPLAAVARRCRREGDYLVLRLGRRRDEGHRRRALTGAEVRAADHRAVHRTAHVQRQEHRLVARNDVAEGQVERLVKRVHDLGLRVPRQAALETLAGRVGLEREQHRHRVDAGLLEALLVPQALNDQLLGLAHGADQPDAGHLAEVADHGRHRHVLEQRLPNLDAVQRLGRDRLTRQVMLGDELNQALLVRLLGVLEGRDDFRQALQAGGLVGLLNQNTLDLALDGVRPARQEGVHALEHPTKDGLPSRATRLRVRQPEQVRVGPAVALLILDRLIRQSVSLLVIPPANRMAEAATPAAHGVDVFSEVEQVRSDAADRRNGLVSSLLDLLDTVDRSEGQGKDRRVVLVGAARRRDFRDHLDGADAVRLQALDDRVVRLLDQVALLDVVSAALGTED